MKKSYLETTKEKFNNLILSDNILVLAIETSCDDTSLALIKNGREVVGSVLSSQVDIHALFGGVVPEVASRNHLLSITLLLEQLLKQTKTKLEHIDCVAVTYGAGLVGPLMVGVNFAKSLSYAMSVPLIKVNHIRAHVSANYITHKDLQPPFLSLIISGGHTALVYVDSTFAHNLIATTKDDAVGEAYDKVAKVLGLGYPGGPAIDKLAKRGKADIKFVKNFSKSEASFSYSGLKTAVINYIHKLRQNEKKVSVEDVSASFQSQAVEQLVAKSVYFLKKQNQKKLVVAGGVSANSHLRERLICEGIQQGFEVYFPELKYCTDNAAMVGSEAYFLIKSGKGLADLTLTADAMINLKNTLPKSQ